MHFHGNRVVSLGLASGVMLYGTLLTTFACYPARQSRMASHPDASVSVTHTESSDAGASVPHPEFSATRVEALREGITTKHVRLLFGPPDAIETRMYGTATPEPWAGLVYQYKMARSGDDLLDEAAILLLKTNEIIFSTSGEEAVVSYFNIRVTYPDARVPEYAQLPEGFNDLVIPHDRFEQFAALVYGASNATLAGNYKEAIDKCHRALELASNDEQRSSAVYALASTYFVRWPAYGVLLIYKKDFPDVKAAMREVIGLC